MRRSDDDRRNDSGDQDRRLSCTCLLRIREPLARPTAAGTIATKLGIEARELSDEPRGPHPRALTRASTARRNDAASLSDISTVPSAATLRSSMFIGPMPAERTAAREARTGSAGRAPPRPSASTARRFPHWSWAAALEPVEHLCRRPRSEVCGAPGRRHPDRAPTEALHKSGYKGEPSEVTKLAIRYPVYGYTSIFENR